MKPFLSLLSLSLLASSALASHQAPRHMEASQVIRVNGHAIMLPANSDNHALQISEEKRGNKTFVIIQSHDVNTGQTLRKVYKFNNPQPEANTHQRREYSTQHPYSARDIQQAPSEQQAQLERQQQWRELMSEQQAQMAEQMQMMNQQIAQLQHQFALQAQAAHTPPPAAQPTQKENEPADYSAPHQPWWKIIMHKANN
jgi:flagellar biosynthesis GTPase FlhF